MPGALTPPVDVPGVEPLPAVVVVVDDGVDDEVDDEGQTEMVTVDPLDTVVPPTGLWAATFPAPGDEPVQALAGAGELETVSPWPWRAWVAADWESPTTSCTTTWDGPVDTMIVTELPAFTLVPAAGVVPITSPFPTVEEGWLV